MSKFVSYGSIDQYRGVVHNTVKWFEHNNKPKGKLSFHGTVKLHGTNAGIGYDPATGEIWAQSRSNIISVGDDNAGFAAYVERNKVEIRAFMEKAQFLLQHKGIFVAFGEWCGGNIQKGVALTGLEKMFVLFDIKIVSPTEEEENYYIDSAYLASIYNIRRAQLETINFYCSEFFQTYDIEIDFSFPESSVQPLIDITEAVEKECPVGKHFGVSGIGEGVVWKCVSFPNSRFKSKGEQHSDTKVKVIVAVDIEKVNSIREFVQNVLTDHRLDKMVDLLKQQSIETVPQNTGAFLKLVANDILKEETDVIVGSGLDWKDIAGPLSKSARDWWLKKCQEL